LEEFDKTTKYFKQILWLVSFSQFLTFLIARFEVLLKELFVKFGEFTKYNICVFYFFL